MPEVEIALGDGTQRQGKCVKLRGTRILFGRTMRCTIRLTDESASREHAALMLEDGVWFIRDLGSRNGTFVNGYPVRSLALHPGDEVRFGEAGPDIRILDLSPALPDDSIPVLDPVEGPPVGAVPDRAPPWLGLPALFLIAVALVVTSLEPDEDLRPVARAVSPRSLFGIVTRAIRERHHESIFDVLSERGRRQVEATLAAPDGSGFDVREAVLRAGRSGGEPRIDWWSLVGVDLAPDGRTGKLVTRSRRGEDRENRIVLEAGGWRLDESEVLPLKSPAEPSR